MRNSEAFVLLAMFAIGVAVRTLMFVPLAVVCWLLFLALVVGVVWRKNRKAVFAPVLFITGLSIALFSVGLLRVEVASWAFMSSSLETKVGERVVLEGVVVREPDLRTKTVHLYVDTSDDVVLVTTDRLSRVSYGDIVKVEGVLKRPESFTTELGRTFDYSGYLLARGVQYQVSFAEISIEGKGGGNVLMATLLNVKKNFVEKLDVVITEPAVGLGKGLLLGIKSALGEDIEKDFRRAGLTHIVVLSGYNVMLVVAFMLFCAAYIFGLRTRIIVGLVGIVAFAMIVGLSATVVRASIMACLVLLAQLVGRRYDVLRALCFAAAMMLFINPYILMYDVGFQLSFMATLGLVLFLPQFESTVLNDTKTLHLKEFFLATLVTQITVLPLLWYHIGEVSLVAVLVNVVVLPLVPLAMLATFTAGVTAFFSEFLGLAFGFVAWLLLQSILYVAHLAATMPFATVILPPISPIVVILLYIALFSAWWIFKERKMNAQTMNDWVIEEEKGGASLDAPPSDEVPVFFR